MNGCVTGRMGLNIGEEKVFNLDFPFKVNERAYRRFRGLERAMAAALVWKSAARALSRVSKIGMVQVS